MAMCWRMFSMRGEWRFVSDPVTLVQQVGSFVASGFFSASGRVLVSPAPAHPVRKRAFTGGAARDTFSVIQHSPGVFARWPSRRMDCVQPWSRQDSGSADQNIWLWETMRENSTRLTFDTGRANAPVWTPDGRQSSLPPLERVPGTSIERPPTSPPRTRSC